MFAFVGVGAEVTQRGENWVWTLTSWCEPSGEEEIKGLERIDARLREAPPRGLNRRLNRGTPKWLALTSSAEVNAARFATLSPFPRITPRRPKSQLFPLWRDLSRLPTNVRRIPRTANRG